MNLRFIHLLFFITLLTSSCSVYKSTGRKSFENKSSGNIPAAGVVVKDPESAEMDDSEELDETCWNQPASDPLWHLDPQSALTVTKKNNDEIQVCLQAP